MKRSKGQVSSLPVIVCLLALLTMASCTAARKLNYFNNLSDSTYVRLPDAVEEERVIDKGDLLDIAFNARDPAAVSPFNKQTSNTGTGAMTPIPGAQAAPAPAATAYTVDPLGFIELPVIGKMEVRGMTARQLKARLTTLVTPYLKEPMIDVKFSGFSVTVLGEVRAPGTFSLPGPKTTVFQALAAAGDLPYSAKKYNIRLYRDHGGERSVTRIDLTNKSLLYNQQTFQMKPNDVIYVQTRRGSIFKEDFGLVASIVTLVVSVVTLGITISK